MLNRDQAGYSQPIALAFNARRRGELISVEHRFATLTLATARLRYTALDFFSGE